MNQQRMGPSIGRGGMRGGMRGGGYMMGGGPPRGNLLHHNTGIHSAFAFQQQHIKQGIVYSISSLSFL